MHASTSPRWLPSPPDTLNRGIANEVIGPRLPEGQAQLAELPKRALWVLGTNEGPPLRYEVVLETIGTIYTTAGVTVPPSETGATLRWHSRRHTFGTELAARGVPLSELQLGRKGEAGARSLHSR